MQAEAASVRLAVIVYISVMLGVREYKTLQGNEWAAPVYGCQHPHQYPTLRRKRCIVRWTEAKFMSRRWPIAIGLLVAAVGAYLYFACRVEPMGGDSEAVAWVGLAVAAAGLLTALINLVQVVLVHRRKPSPEPTPVRSQKPSRSHVTPLFGAHAWTTHRDE